MHPGARRCRGWWPGASVRRESPCSGASSPAAPKPTPPGRVLAEPKRLRLFNVCRVAKGVSDLLPRQRHARDRRQPAGPFLDLSDGQRGEVWAGPGPSACGQSGRPYPSKKALAPVDLGVQRQPEAIGDAGVLLTPPPRLTRSEDGKPCVAAPCASGTSARAHGRPRR